MITLRFFLEYFAFRHGKIDAMSLKQNKTNHEAYGLRSRNKGNLLVYEELFARVNQPQRPDIPPGPEASRCWCRCSQRCARLSHVISNADGRRAQSWSRFTQWGTHVGAPLMGMPPSGRRAEWTEIGATGNRELAMSSKVVRSR